MRRKTLHSVPFVDWKGTGGTPPEFHGGAVPRACRMEGLQGDLEGQAWAQGHQLGRGALGNGSSSLDRPGSTLNEEGRPQPALPRGPGGTQQAQLQYTVRGSRWLRPRGSWDLVQRTQRWKDVQTGQGPQGPLERMPHGTAT